MRFDKPQPAIDFPAMERSILDFWKRSRIFERSVEEKSTDNQWSFYDGPPFATGLPHYGHLLPGTIKDVVPRYWAMRGKRIERRFGWDCHGLPVEFEIQKTLGLDTRQDIEAYGIDRFNESCRSIVLRYTGEWRRTVDRMGRWIDFDHDYKTMDPDFMESVWAVFKKLWDRGLIYEDRKVLPYSTKITTPLSNFEAGLNYQDVQDPSITVKLRLRGEHNRYLLAWTTTPWTLPANLAVAVHPELGYAEIEEKASGDHYFVLEESLGALFAKHGGPEAYAVLRRMEGKELVGLRYEQLIPAFEGRLPENAHQVLAGYFVTADTGTGLVHIAPAFGEDDYVLGKSADIEPLDHLSDDGVITADVPLFAGQWFKDADRDIIRYLKEQGLLFRHETVVHSYPYCYRSDTPLIYRAISTWFVRVTALKDALVANNQQIRWVPEYLKDGRFGKWLEGARDWAISRNRYWGNPIPIWRDAETGETLCIGSRAELEERTGQQVPDLHKHFVDPLAIRSPKTGRELRRIPEVLDCWFESGSMPYAQQHYPFAMSEDEFARIFPADFIAEGLDQTRGWFYTLHVLSTALEKGPAFRNVVVNGIVLAEDGRKMSKRLKNYTDPNEVFEKNGADTLRIYLLQSGAVRAEDLRFSDKGLEEMTRKVLLPFWNAYAFLATYAAVDGWDPAREYTDERDHVLDRWISSKAETLKASIHREMESYQLSRTVPPLLSFLDDLTNWYIRRSRRRFWKSENDRDKQQAYSTLYAVLVDFCKLAAPFIPFITEEIYGRLRLGHPLAAADSVHLDAYPEARRQTDAEIALEYEMDLTRSVVELGRELREKLKVRNRQPLATLFVGMVHPEDVARFSGSLPPANHDAGPGTASAVDDSLTGTAPPGSTPSAPALWAPLLEIVREELNVKEVRFLPFHDMAEWVVKPNFKLLGKTLGARMKDFQQVCASLPEESAFALLDGSAIEILGDSYDKEAFTFELKPKESFHHPCHSAGELVVALDTEITEALRFEGLSRELINRVQRFRKDSGLQVDDRIQLFVTAPEELTRAFLANAELIEQETLAVLTVKDPGTSSRAAASRKKAAAEPRTANEEIEGQDVTIAIAKAG